MPVGDRQLRLIIDAEVRKARQDIESLRRDVGRSAGGIQRSFAGAGVAAAGFGVATALAVRQTVLAGAELQRTRVQFEVLAGSIEAGRQRFAELTAFAREVPISFDAITAAARQLSAVGVVDEEAINRIRQLGDVTLGNEQAFRRLSLQYTQVVAKQRVLLEEVNRFTEAGVPLIETLRQVISETRGAEQSTADLFKAIEAGEVTVDDLNAALDRLTDAGGRFAGGLERGAEAISGQLAKVSDAVQVLQFRFTEANEGAIFDFTDRILTLVNTLSELDPSTLRGITTALGVLLGTLGAVAGIAVSVRAVRALQTAFEGVSTAVRAVSAASPVLRAASASTRVYTAALDGASLGNSRFAASQLASGTASRSLLVSLRATSAFAAGPYVLAFAAAAGGALLLLHATRDVRREAEFLRQVLADEIEPAEGVDALREQLEQLQEVYQRVQQDAEKFRPGSRGADLAERAMRRLRVEITEVGVALQEVTGTRIISLPQLAATVDLVTEQMRTLNDEIEQLRAADGDTRQIEALVEEYNLAGTELGSLLAIQRELQGIEFLDDADPIRFASEATEATEAWRILRDDLAAGVTLDQENLNRSFQIGLITPLEQARGRVMLIEAQLRELVEFRADDGDSFFNPDGSAGKTITAIQEQLESARGSLSELEPAARRAGQALNTPLQVVASLRQALRQISAESDAGIIDRKDRSKEQLEQIDRALRSIIQINLDAPTEEAGRLISLLSMLRADAESGFDVGPLRFARALGGGATPSEQEATRQVEANARFIATVSARAFREALAEGLEGENIEEVFFRVVGRSGITRAEAEPVLERLVQQVLGDGAEDASTALAELQTAIADGLSSLDADLDAKVEQFRPIALRLLEAGGLGRADAERAFDEQSAEIASMLDDLDSDLDAKTQQYRPVLLRLLEGAGLGREDAAAAFAEQGAEIAAMLDDLDADLDAKTQQYRPVLLKLLEGAGLGREDAAAAFAEQGAEIAAMLDDLDADLDAKTQQYRPVLLKLLEGAGLGREDAAAAFAEQGAEIAAMLDDLDADLDAKTQQYRPVLLKLLEGAGLGREDAAAAFAEQGAEIAAMLDDLDADLDAKTQQYRPVLLKLLEGAGLGREDAAAAFAEQGAEIAAMLDDLDADLDAKTQQYRPVLLKLLEGAGLGREDAAAAFAEQGAEIAAMLDDLDADLDAKTQQYRPVLLKLLEGAGLGREDAAAAFAEQGAEIAAMLDGLDADLDAKTQQYRPVLLKLLEGAGLGREDAAAAFAEQGAEIAAMLDDLDADLDAKTQQYRPVLLKLLEGAGLGREDAAAAFAEQGAEIASMLDDLDADLDAKTQQYRPVLLKLLEGAGLGREDAAAAFAEQGAEIAAMLDGLDADLDAKTQQYRPVLLKLLEGAGLGREDAAAAFAEQGAEIAAMLDGLDADLDAKTQQYRPVLLKLLEGAGLGREDAAAAFAEQGAEIAAMLDGLDADLDAKTQQYRPVLLKLLEGAGLGREDAAAAFAEQGAEIAAMLDGLDADLDAKTQQYRPVLLKLLEGAGLGREDAAAAFAEQGAEIAAMLDNLDADLDAKTQQYRPVLLKLLEGAGLGREDAAAAFAEQGAEIASMLDNLDSDLDAKTQQYRPVLLKLLEGAGLGREDAAAAFAEQGAEIASMLDNLDSDLDAKTQQYRPVLLKLLEGAGLGREDAAAAFAEQGAEIAAMLDNLDADLDAKARQYRPVLLRVLEGGGLGREDAAAAFAEVEAEFAIMLANIDAEIDERTERISGGVLGNLLRNRAVLVENEELIKQLQVINRLERAGVIVAEDAAGRRVSAYQSVVEALAEVEGAGAFFLDGRLVANLGFDLLLSQLKESRAEVDTLNKAIRDQERAWQSVSTAASAAFGPEISGALDTVRTAIMGGEVSTADWVEGLGSVASALTGGEWDGAIRAAEGLVRALESGDTFGTIVAGISLVVSVVTAASRQLTEAAIRSAQRAADEAQRIVRDSIQAINRQLADSEGFVDAIYDQRLRRSAEVTAQEVSAAEDVLRAGLDALRELHGEENRLAEMQGRMQLDMARELAREQIDVARMTAGEQRDLARMAAREQIDVARRMAREQIDLVRMTAQVERDLAREADREQIDLARRIARDQERGADDLFGDQVSSLRVQLDEDLISHADYEIRRRELQAAARATEIAAQEELALFESVVADEARSRELDADKAFRAEKAALDEAFRATEAAAKEMQRSVERAADEVFQAAELASKEQVAALEEEIERQKFARLLQLEEEFEAERERLTDQRENVAAEAARRELERNTAQLEELHRLGLVSDREYELALYQQRAQAADADMSLRQELFDFEVETLRRLVAEIEAARRAIGRADDRQERIDSLQARLADLRTNPPNVITEIFSFGAAGREHRGRINRAERALQRLIEQQEADNATVGLQTGGIVTRPTQALIGEAGPEAVIPLDRLDAGGDVYVTINMEGSVVAEGELVETVTRGVERAQRRGRVRAL